jgi:hypothetical protein
MTSLTSAIDPGSAEFARNAAAMKALVADLRGKLKAAARKRARGTLRAGNCLRASASVCWLGTWASSQGN